MHAGLVHQTGIVKVGTGNDTISAAATGGREEGTDEGDWGDPDDPTSIPNGVVHLTSPLPYIPFILFHRYDGTRSNPVTAYPANQLDISHSGVIGDATMGVLEHKSSHTDPTLYGGDIGSDPGPMMTTPALLNDENQGESHAHTLNGHGIITPTYNYLTPNPTGVPKQYAPVDYSGRMKWGDFKGTGTGYGGGGHPAAYVYAFQMSSVPGIVYKWMLMETIKLRTFAYVRAGKDRFEITARNALGLEGREDESHGKYERAGNDVTGKVNKLEYMWDQRDDTANGVLPPSVYTAEHINCLLYTSPSQRDQRGSRMAASA